MSSKVKPSAETKAAALKKPSIKVAPPATKRPTIALYSLNMGDVTVVTYYNNEGIDYAKVKVHFNGMIPPGISCFLLAEDRMLVS
jgi:hypothetical protein